MIDFDALVLAPAMAAFAGQITITPAVSMPGAPAYDARGSYASKPVTVQIDDTDLVHQTQQPMLGIRLSEFVTPPAQGDFVSRKAGVAQSSGTLPDGIFEIYNIEFDGLGGADLALRQTDRS